MPKTRRSTLGRELRRQGFDLTEYDRSDRYYRPRCSECQVLVINGTACHETGCPNARRAYRRLEQRCRSVGT